MKKKIIVLIVAVTVLMVGVKLMDKAKKSKLANQAAIERAEDVKQIEQKVLSFSIDGRTAGGIKSWHLEGKTAEIFENEIRLNDLKAYAFSESGKIDLSSDRGTYRRSKGEVELFGNVKVVNDQGVVLTSESAKWSQNTKEISSEDVVYIEHEKMKAKGLGALANSEEQRAILKKNVEVTIEPDTEVKCDGSLEVNYGDSTAVFRDNVKVRDKEGKLFSDVLTVYFDPESNKLVKVEADGNVKVQKGRSYTLCEKAVYTDSTRHAKLTGRARVILDPQEIEELNKF